jgi:23S rRNA pseudoU1915 N3-methylase RlmH
VRLHANQLSSHSLNEAPVNYLFTENFRTIKIVRLVVIEQIYRHMTCRTKLYLNFVFSEGAVDLCHTI